MPEDAVNRLGRHLVTNRPDWTPSSTAEHDRQQEWWRETNRLIEEARRQHIDVVAMFAAFSELVCAWLEADGERGPSEVALAARRARAKETRERVMAWLDDDSRATLSCEAQPSLTDEERATLAAGDETISPLELLGRLEHQVTSWLANAAKGMGELRRALAAVRNKPQHQGLREPTSEEMEKALGDKVAAFYDGWTIRRCVDCRRPVAGGPTRCWHCVGVLEERERHAAEAITLGAGQSLAWLDTNGDYHALRDIKGPCVVRLHIKPRATAWRCRPGWVLCGHCKELQPRSDPAHETQVCRKCAAEMEPKELPDA